MKQRWLLAVTLWLSAPLWLSAQVSTGKITGQVTDSSGAIIQNAPVVVTNVDTNVARNLSTDSAGLYSAPNLVPGQYSVQVSMSGFQSQVKTGLAVSIGQTITLNFTLQPGTQKESVEVVSTAQQLVDTTTSSLSTVITTSQVENLPLNSRNFLDLVPLVPGAQPGAQGRNLTQNSFSINGGRVTANGFQIDGADIDTPSNDPVRVSPNLEGVGEFQVLTNNFSAEWGRSMGGVIDVKLKSGTNQLHGSIFEYFRNTVLDASQAFSTPPQLPYNFNQFGAAAGGPIIKDRLFVFGDYQGERILTIYHRQPKCPTCCAGSAFRRLCGWKTARNLRLVSSFSSEASRRLTRSGSTIQPLRCGASRLSKQSDSSQFCRSDYGAHVFCVPRAQSGLRRRESI